MLSPGTGGRGDVSCLLVVVVVVVCPGLQYVGGSDGATLVSWKEIGL